MVLLVVADDAVVVVVCVVLAVATVVIVNVEGSAGTVYGHQMWHTGSLANNYGINKMQTVIRFIFKSDLTRIKNVFRYPQVNLSIEKWLF